MTWPAPAGDYHHRLALVLAPAAKIISNRRARSVAEARRHRYLPRNHRRHGRGPSDS